MLNTLPHFTARRQSDAATTVLYGSGELCATLATIAKGPFLLPVPPYWAAAAKAAGESVSTDQVMHEVRLFSLLRDPLANPVPRARRGTKEGFEPQVNICCFVEVLPPASTPGVGDLTGYPAAVYLDLTHGNGLGEFRYFRAIPSVPPLFVKTAL